MTKIVQKRHGDFTPEYDGLAQRLLETAGAVLPKFVPGSTVEIHLCPSEKEMAFEMVRQQKAKARQRGYPPGLVHAMIRQSASQVADGVPAASYVGVDGTFHVTVGLHVLENYSSDRFPDVLAHEGGHCKAHAAVGVALTQQRMPADFGRLAFGLKAPEEWMGWVVQGCNEYAANRHALEAGFGQTMLQLTGQGPHGSDPPRRMVVDRRAATLDMSLALL